MYKDKIIEINRQLEKLEKEKKKLIQEKKQLAELPYAYRLAIYLHEQFCIGNHTDYCGWHYEDDYNLSTWNSKNSTHNMWLKKSRDLLDFLKNEEPVHPSDPPAPPSDRIFKEGELPPETIKPKGIFDK